jgi:eukaryotic-like serine/threonine-protein kinase
VLDGEARVGDAEWSRDGALANQRRLRALLHLVDLETARAEADTAVVRARVRRAVQVLLRRLAAGPDGMVHRILCAALARSFDAAVREGVAEPSDFLLLVSRMLDDRHSLEAITEGSTHPEVTAVMAAYLRFIEPNLDGSDNTEDSVARRLDDGGERVRHLARRVIALSHGIGAGSYRSEALRQVLLRLGRALEHVATARGISELIDPAGTADPIGDIETSVDALRRLASAAARRLFADDSVLGEIAIVTQVASLSMLLGRVVSSGVPANARQLKAAVSELVADLPQPVGTAIEQVLARLESLPVTALSAPAIPLEKRRAALPDWLLPRRTIGAFYVVRALGAGGGSSVFVARRIEERHVANADSFALKVPQYDPTTARSLSEQEFLQLFREEAGALLSLPQHNNLARFVTFDLAAKPKPILVMELIAGAGLDRLIRSRTLTTERALGYLDGILGGLEAMHAVGVGHLDVKPSNVILRDGETPVLVDFGLSGRHLRPGCGTLEYCAPEVLGIVPEGHTPSPVATDIYAFACLAFEVLTAQLLFDAEDEGALANQQVAHDGWPKRLSDLAGNPVNQKLCIVLAACLRRDPRARPTVKDTRRALHACAAEVKNASWPLSPGRVPQGMSA